MAADLDRIGRNIQRLVQQSAPDDDIQDYLDGEGVTLDQVMAHQPQRGPVGRAVDTVGRTVNRAINAVQGTQDPAFQDVPAYAADTPETMQGQAQAKAYAIDDKAYGDILRKQLGDRFVRKETDANGYEVIVYRDEGGQEKKGYVNRPGLDWQDVDRGLSATTPYLASAGPVAKLTSGAGAVGRGLWQLAAGGGTNLAQQRVAQDMGSEQPMDLGQAGLTGALQGFAAVARPLTAGAVTGGTVGAMTDGDAEDKIAGGLFGALGGAGIGKGIEKIQAPRINPGATDDAGNLAGTMRQRAESAGLDTAKMSPDDVDQWLTGVTLTKDQTELAAAIETGKFGLTTTKGQRTKDPQLLSVEKDARYGNLGDEAKKLLAAFDAEQKLQIEGSALRRTPLPRGGATTQPADPYRDGMGAMVAPNRNDTMSRLVTPDELGSGINKGVSAARQGGDELINKAWKDVTDIVPADEAMPLLAQKVGAKVGDLPIDEMLTPAATRMEKELAAFVQGEAKSGSPGLIGEKSVKTVDQMRRRLLSIRDAAGNQTDRSTAKAIYDGFNDWIDEIAEQGFIKGKPEAAAALRTARQVTAEVKQAFAPIGPGGKKGPAAKILQDIVDGADTPERIVGRLLGSGGPQTVPNAGSVEAVQQIKRVLFQGVRGNKLVDEKLAASTWGDLRMAYWSRLIINKSGDMHTPQMIVNNVEAALKNQRSLMLQMFDKNEMKVFSEYVGAMKRLAYKDPNPSGTATALRAAYRNENSWLKEFFNTQSKRELFSKHNVLMSRFYQFLAKKVPANIFGSRDMIGSQAAKRAIDQNLTPRAAMNAGGYAGSAGSQSDAQRQ